MNWVFSEAQPRPVPRGSVLSHLGHFSYLLHYLSVSEVPHVDNTSFLIKAGVDPREVFRRWARRAVTDWSEQGHQTLLHLYTRKKKTLGCWDWVWQVPQHALLREAYHTSGKGYTSRQTNSLLPRDTVSPSYVSLDTSFAHLPSAKVVRATFGKWQWCVLHMTRWLLGFPHFLSTICFIT